MFEFTTYLDALNQLTHADFVAPAERAAIFKRILQRTRHHRQVENLADINEKALRDAAENLEIF